MERITVIMVANDTRLFRIFEKIDYEEPPQDFTVTS